MSSEEKGKVPLSVGWDGVRSAQEWINSQPSMIWKQMFDQNGYVVVDSLVNDEELAKYKELYDKLLGGEVDVSSHRHDLGNTKDEVVEGTENITQIMWPSVYVENLKQGPIHQRTEAVAKLLLGDDMAFDFDMLIAKLPNTDTVTPWHQDESYWPDLPDSRAVSCWVPMEEATLENGCMWYIPGSHKELRPSRPAKEGCHVLTCDGSEEEGKAFPVSAGSCTFHHGRTVHYARGNSTDTPRRAFITAYRPTDMVAAMRQQGFDHGLKGVHEVIKTGKTHKGAKEGDREETTSST